MFFYKKNLSSPEVHKMESPWRFVSKAPYDLDKGEFESWSLNASTDHAFISAFEGVNPNIACSQENPPIKMWALIIDYDGLVPDDPIPLILKKFQGSYLPTWIARTKSDKARAIWLLEGPLSLCSLVHGQKFAEFMGQQVKVKRMFGDPDPASYRPSQFFEIGKNWQRIPGAKPIPMSVISMWDAEVFEAVTRKVRTTLHIPFEFLKEKTEELWPGRVPDFRLGAHCLRFWDPKSDNATGCVIKNDGVRIYVTGKTWEASGDGPFKTWEQIFGREFVNEFKAKKYEEAGSDCYYDASRGKYVVKNANDEFLSVDRSTFLSYAASLGFSNTKGKADLLSPAADFANMIMLQRSVHRLDHILFHDVGIIRQPNGERVLNVSLVKPVAPAEARPYPKDSPWHDKAVNLAFPLIHDLITSLFRDPDQQTEVVDPQLLYFLSWLSSYYVSSYDRKPLRGQALFLCGGKNRGKTFLSRVVVARLMGGWTDASPYFTGTANWNSDFRKNGILVIDDSAANSSAKTHQCMQDRVKAYVANGTVKTDGKYETIGDGLILNRLIVTLNSDPSSKKILPGLDNNNRDKVSYLRLTEGEHRRPLEAVVLEGVIRGMTDQEREARVIKELPAFARWLYEFETPECFRTSRFGVAAVQHPELDVSSQLQSGYGQEILEGLDDALEGMTEPFRGNTTNLLMLLTASNRILERNLDNYKLARTLAALSADGYAVKASKVHNLDHWEIDPNVVKLGRIYQPGRVGELTVTK